MANAEQLEILKQGFEVWNKWREKNPHITIDLKDGYLLGVNIGKAHLSGADLYRAMLYGADLGEADLSGADLREANLTGANLSAADLRNANLSAANISGCYLTGANLSKAVLSDADLTGAYLSKADLNWAYLDGANLSKADLSEANLEKAILEKADLGGAKLNQANLRGANLNTAQLFEASLIGAQLSQANLFGADLMAADLSGSDLTGATLARATMVSTKIDKAKVSGSWVYAVNVWDLEGEFDEQRDLIITHKGQPIITVDNIKVAQFIYLILNNEDIRGVINTLTSKSVLILGRFAIPERKAILDALRNKLREYDLLPIVFDFDRPTDKDFTETIKTLAGLCYFVIADITNPKSSPLELQATVPDYQIPFVPIIQEGEQPFAMMVDLQKKYPWVLDTLSYNSIETLIKALKPAIIDPAIQKHNELRLIKARKPKIKSASDFIDDKGLDNQSN